MPKERREFKVPKEDKGQRGIPATKGRLVLKGRQVPKATREFKVLKGRKVLKEK